MQCRSSVRKSSNSDQQGVRTRHSISQMHTYKHATCSIWTALFLKCGVSWGSLWPAVIPANCTRCVTRVTRADVFTSVCLRRCPPPCTHEALAYLVLCRGCARSSLRSGAPWGRIRGRVVRTVVAGRTTMTTNGGNSSSRRRGRVRLACLVVCRMGEDMSLLLGISAWSGVPGGVVGPMLRRGSVAWVPAFSRATGRRFELLFPVAVLRGISLWILCVVWVVC